MSSYFLLVCSFCIWSTMASTALSTFSRPSSSFAVSFSAMSLSNFQWDYSASPKSKKLYRMTSSNSNPFDSYTVRQSILDKNSGTWSFYDCSRTMITWLQPNYGFDIPWACGMRLICRLLPHKTCWRRFTGSGMMISGFMPLLSARSSSSLSMLKGKRMLMTSTTEFAMSRIYACER